MKTPCIEMLNKPKIALKDILTNSIPLQDSEENGWKNAEIHWWENNDTENQYEPIKNKVTFFQCFFSCN